MSEALSHRGDPSGLPIPAIVDAFPMTITGKNPEVRDA
jgi:hypothetical protein